MFGKGSTHHLVDLTDRIRRVDSWLKIYTYTNLKSDYKKQNRFSKVHNKSPKYSYLNSHFIGLC